ncbi:MAG: murein biosynthesis integral membrane protein MurJ [Nitrospirota bacterium]
MMSREIVEEESRRITRAAGIVGIATFLSRILGFVRDMVLARFFGATQAADAFFVAFRIPNLLRELFAEGSMSAAFIPVFTEYLTVKSKKEALRVASVAFTLLLVALSIIVLLGIAVAPLIVMAIAPGFVPYPEKFSLTIELTRIMFPYLLFIGLSAVAMGVLNSMRAFTSPALSPAMFNIIVIASIIIASVSLDNPIIGVAVGVVIGGIFQFFFQLPSLRSRGINLQFVFDIRHPGIRRIGTLMLPSFFGLAIMQINIFVSTILASYLAEGSVTYLYYGMRLIHFPLGIFGVALATAILPALSEQVSRNEFAKMKETFSFGLRFVTSITVPAAVGLIVLREPIVNLLFQRGKFDYIATVGTAEAVLFYSLGLWAFAGVRMVVSAFYSMQDTKTPVKAAAIAMIANIVLSIVLMFPLRHGGLALATSMASAINLGILIVVLRGRLGSIDGKNILKSLLKITVSSFIMGIWGWQFLRGDIWMIEGHYTEKALLLSVVLITSIGVYLLLLKVLKSEELSFLWRLVTRKRSDL